MFDPIQAARFRELNGIDPEVLQIARENDWWDLLDEDGNPVPLPDEVDATQPPLF